MPKVLTFYIVYGDVRKFYGRSAYYDFVDIDLRIFRRSFQNNCICTCIEMNCCSYGTNVICIIGIVLHCRRSYAVKPRYRTEKRHVAVVYFECYGLACVCKFYGPNSYNDILRHRTPRSFYVLLFGFRNRRSRPKGQGYVAFLFRRYRPGYGRVFAGEVSYCADRSARRFIARVKRFCFYRNGIVAVPLVYLNVPGTGKNAVFGFKRISFHRSRCGGGGTS